MEWHLALRAQAVKMCTFRGFIRQWKAVNFLLAGMHK